MGNCLNSINDRFSHSDSTDPTYVDLSSIIPFSKGSNLGSTYTLGPELGRGQHGIIHSCTSHALGGASFACKSISKLNLSSQGDIKGAAREVHIMKLLSDHVCDSECGIVHLHDVIEDESCIHLILELCKGGELFERIVSNKCFSEANAAKIMKSLLETIQYCHSIGIMHRDIKPENILFVEDSDTSPIRLADFGLAQEFTEGQKFSGIVGSSFYMAPEVLQGEYSAEIDIWSAGVVMYVLLSGYPPFWGATEKHIYNAIQKGDLTFPSEPWDYVSGSAKDLICKMLHTDPKQRITATEALEHEWIRLKS